MQALKAVSLLENKKIAIVGGGPGGLMLARLLQLKGATVNVYERDINRDARVQGAIVDLHFESGLKVMKAAGLMDAFKDSYMPGADRFRFVDKDGNICMEEDRAQAGADFDDEHFRPEIDRGALRKVLLEALLPGTVIWDSAFAAMEEMGEGWLLTFKNGTTASADIVVGCDGYRSKIRPYLTGIKALYSGATIIQGEIHHPEKDCPEMDALVNKANLIAMGPGKTVAAQPRGDGGLTFYAASLYPENWVATSGIDFNDSAAVRAWLMQYYSDWNPLFFTLFDACKHFVPRPLYYFPLDQYWEAKPHLTLIGDAAHLMPPSGEGVNTAMLDALDLSECLTGGVFKDLTSAIAAYEAGMRARAAVLAQEALDGIEGFASPTDASVKELVAQFSKKD